MFWASQNLQSLPSSLFTHGCKNETDISHVLCVSHHEIFIYGCVLDTGYDCKIVLKKYLHLVFVQLRNVGFAMYPRFPTGFRTEGPPPCTSLPNP